MCGENLRNILRRRIPKSTLHTSHFALQYNTFLITFFLNKIYIARTIPLSLYFISHVIYIIIQFIHRCERCDVRSENLKNILRRKISKVTLHTSHFTLQLIILQMNRHHFLGCLLQVHCQICRRYRLHHLKGFRLL